MKPFWHPLSAVFMVEPRVRASSQALRLFLRVEKRLRLIYAGDRLWPALRHNQDVTVVAADESDIRPGMILLLSMDGIPELLRVEATKDGLLRLTADAEPSRAQPIPRPEIIGRLADPYPSRRRSAALTRAWLDVMEGWSGRPDPAADSADTVRDKYEEQAPHYAALEGAGLEQDLLDRIRSRVPVGGRVLVAGSGIGRECFALAGVGFRVKGVDYATRMVEIARRLALQRNIDVEFVAADLRKHQEPSGSLDAIVFTYDVYSFIPNHFDRHPLLHRMRSWLVPRGTLFLSARRVQGLWDRTMLSLQWLAGRLNGWRPEWGDTHTRWIDEAGRLRRSYVHMFTPRSLRRDARAGGLALVEWRAGHGTYVERSDTRQRAL